MLRLKLKLPLRRDRYRGTESESHLIRERLNLQVAEVYSLLIRPGIAPGFIFEALSEALAR